MINCDYRIGATLLGIVRLPDLGIPDPFVPLFDPFSLRTVNGDGIVFGQGYPSFVWQWPALSVVQLNTLRTRMRVTLYVSGAVPTQSVMPASMSPNAPCVTLL